MSDVFQDLKKYAHKLVDSGLVVGAGGNSSMRDGDDMYISPSGFDWKEREVADGVKENIDTGETLPKSNPPSELWRHLECFSRIWNTTPFLIPHPVNLFAVSV